MYGIFDEREAATFRAWVDTVQAGERPRSSWYPKRPVMSRLARGRR
jgi:hypothetical protein